MEGQERLWKVKLGMARIQTVIHERSVEYKINSKPVHHDVAHRFMFFWCCYLVYLPLRWQHILRLIRSCMLDITANNLFAPFSNSCL